MDNAMSRMPRGAAVVAHRTATWSAGLMAAAIFATAASAGDADLCKDVRAPPEAAIAACDRAIAAGKLRGRALADIHARRGRGFERTNAHDRALEDFNQAIRLAPDWPELHADRANAYLGKRDIDRAIANFDQAIRLDPKLARACEVSERRCRGIQWLPVLSPLLLA